MKKFRELSEQHREKGRFKPTVPHMVPNVPVVSPRSKSDSADVKLREDLRKWFDPKHPEGGWKRINAKGEAIGPCAREPGEAKPKCMSNEKRAALSKKERAAAVSAKRRHDPDAERKGKPINVSNFGKGKLSEEMEQLDEKNAPTNPELWARAKAMAKSKFDVYPSAYANGWAAKWYKSKGGGWKTVSEAKDVREYDYEGDMTKTQLKTIIRNAQKIHDMIEDEENLPEWVQGKITLAKDYIVVSANYLESVMNEEVKQLDELSPATKASYKEKAQKSVKELEPHAKTGEYKDIAQNIINRRKAALAKMKEDVEQIDELSNELLGRYKDKAAEDALKADKEGNFKRGDKRFSGVVKATNKQFDAMRKKPFGEEVEQIDEVMSEPDYNQSIKARQAKADKDKPPFEGGTKPKEKVIAGKFGKGYSTARHLARQAMQKQVEKMKKTPIKEESKKAAIVKGIAKKKNGNSSDKFESQPELNTTLTKNV